MKIYKIAALYLIDKFDVTVIEFRDVKETTKSYMFDGKRLNKEEVNQIEVEVGSSRQVRGIVFILDDNNLEEYTNLLHEKIKVELVKYRNEVDKMIDCVGNWDKRIKTRAIE